MWAYSEKRPIIRSLDATNTMQDAESQHLSLPCCKKDSGRGSSFHMAWLLEQKKPMRIKTVSHSSFKAPLQNHVVKMIPGAIRLHSKGLQRGAPAPQAVEAGASLIQTAGSMTVGSCVERTEISLCIFRVHLRSPHGALSREACVGISHPCCLSVVRVSDLETSLLSLLDPYLSSHIKFKIDQRP